MFKGLKHIVVPSKNRVFDSALYIIIRSLLKFVYVLQWLRTCWNKLLPA